MQSTQYGFIRTDPDGEVYAVRTLDDGTITGACGPLAFREVKTATLPDYAYDDAPELADWLMSETFAGVQSVASYSPLSDEQVRDIETQAEDMSHHA